MPNLTIKPVGAAGNKLILQDQAGGAVLTTADSGATLGNSTQDNITRLGTITAGNLSNSAIIHPVGHFYKYYHAIETTAAPWGASTSIATPAGTILTATVPDDHTAYSHAHGGVTRVDYPANACIAYEIDGSNPDASSTYYKGQRPGNSEFGNVMGVYVNSSGSDVTLKIQITAYGAGNWATAPDRPVYMSITVIKTA